MQWTNPDLVRSSLPRVPLAIRCKLAHHTDIKATKWKTIVWRIEGSESNQ